MAWRCGGCCASSSSSGFQPIAINTQTGTSYTLVLSDAGKLIKMTSSSPNTVVIPPDAAAAFPVGTTIAVMGYGPGGTTIDASSVTLDSAFDHPGDIVGSSGVVELLKLDTDEWQLSQIGGLFDPNEWPVILGQGAQILDLSAPNGTPDNPRQAFGGFVIIGQGALGNGGGANQILIGKAPSAIAVLDPIGIGTSAIVNADYGIAHGYTAEASGARDIAMGYQAFAGGGLGTGHDCTVVGANAASNGHTRSTALGESAANTKDDQIMLGAPGQFTETGKGYVVTDRDGTGRRWIIQVNAGVLAIAAAP